MLFNLILQLAVKNLLSQSLMNKPSVEVQKSFGSLVFYYLEGDWFLEWKLP